MPSDAHVNYPVIASAILRRGAHKNPAWTFHFDALLNQHSLIWVGYAMSDHPSSGAAGCRAGRGIFAVVKKHPRMQACLGVNGFAGDEIEKLPVSFFQIFIGAAQVKTQVPNYFQ